MLTSIIVVFFEARQRLHANQQNNDTRTQGYGPTWTCSENKTHLPTRCTLPNPQWDHPDLAANLVAATPEFKAAHNDDNGHGTHVAGIIGVRRSFHMLTCGPTCAPNLPPTPSHGGVRCGAVQLGGCAVAASG